MVHATRRLMQAAVKSHANRTKKWPMILPPPSATDFLYSAFLGAYQLSTPLEQEPRDAYETFLEKDIIQDQVLQHARAGNWLTYSLFANLYNTPFWKEYDVDFPPLLKQFGPALENFHNILGLLKNDLPDVLLQSLEAAGSKKTESEQQQLAKQIKQEGSEMNDEAVAKIENVAEALLGPNLWRQRALEDSSSLEASFSKMTTKHALDAYYYTHKFELMDQSLLSFARKAAATTTKTTELPDDDDKKNAVAPLKKRYVPDSAIVRSVALLNARAMYVYGYESVKEDEEEALEPNHPPVGAQLDILFEVSHTYDVLVEDDQDENSSSSSKEPQPPRETITNLAVAVVEGWLRAPEVEDRRKGFRWKIAMIREAHEFPFTSATSVRHS